MSFSFSHTTTLQKDLRLANQRVFPVASFSGRSFAAPRQTEPPRLLVKAGREEFQLLHEEDGVLTFGFGDLKESAAVPASTEVSAPAPTTPDEPPAAEPVPQVNEPEVTPESEVNESGLKQAAASPQDNGKVAPAPEPAPASASTSSINDPLVANQAREIVDKVEEAVKEGSAVQQPLITSELNGHGAVSQKPPLSGDEPLLNPREALQQMTVQALKNQCKERGVQGYSKLKKEELVNALLENATLQTV